MTHSQFNNLDQTEQQKVIWEHGVMVGDTIKGEYKINLYQLFSFYAELYYHRKDNVLKMLRSFSCTECLEAYLMQFDLSDLEFLSKR